MTTDVQTAVDVAETEMDADWITPAFGSSFSSAAAVAGVVMVVADADICSFFHVTVHTMCDQQRISPF